MAVYSRAEICRLTGKTQAYLKVNIDRGLLVLNKDKKIDDSIIENREFLEKWGGVESKPKPKAAEVAPVELNAGEKDEVKRLSLKQKRANLRKTVAEADKKELEAAKLRGESVPVELVRNIVAQLSQGFIMSFKDMAENYALEISHEAKLTNEQTAKLRGSLITGINKAMNSSVSIAMKDVNKLAAEIAVKK